MKLGHLVAIVCIVGIGYLAILLFSIYKSRDRKETEFRSRSWARYWEFSPQALGGFSYRSLVLVSFLSLFLEMLVIRWISAEIRIFAYLLGALVGGLMESISLWAGLKSLVVIAMLMYLASYFFVSRPAPSGTTSPS
jgi:small-conductance mechanosensitive channel